MPGCMTCSSSIHSICFRYLRLSSSSSLKFVLEKEYPFDILEIEMRSEAAKRSKIWELLNVDGDNKWSLKNTQKAIIIAD